MRDRAAQWVAPPPAAAVRTNHGAGRAAPAHDRASRALPRPRALAPAVTLHRAPPRRYRAPAASHVGPVANSAETYPWYALPFCRPEGATDEQTAFGDSFSGDRKVATPYVLQWKKDVDSTPLCKKSLSEDDIVRARSAKRGRRRRRHGCATA